MNRYDDISMDDWAELNKIEGWFTRNEASAMQSLVRQLSSGAKVVELGSFQGRSSVVIASVLPPGGMLYCVDHFKGSLEHQGNEFKLDDLLSKFTSNIKNHHVDDKIALLVMDTLQAANEFEMESVDLLFVDASHDYESIRADILYWYSKLKVGGLLVCHDYSTYWPGVREAIESLQLEGQVLADSLWSHQKDRSSEEGSPRSEQVVEVVTQDNSEQMNQVIGEILKISEQTNELIRGILSIKEMLTGLQNSRHDVNDKQQIRGEEHLIPMNKKKSENVERCLVR